jgi:SAM-dependent methyltransferase
MLLLLHAVALPSYTPSPALACPVTKSELKADVSILGGVKSDYLRNSVGTRYLVNEVFADLTPPRAALTVNELADELFSVFSMQTGIFRTPAMAFFYERGWRQNFDAMGFPGIDAEFTELVEFFEPADGGTVVDLSCGSGLMSRRLVRSGRYASVLALDYSEEMLRETSRRFDQEGIPSEGVSLVRADAGALPLRSESIDGVHAGAALHCWPRLETSLAEVSRVLRPGGRFFATTFFEGAVPGRQAQMQQPGTGSMRFFKDESELTELLLQAGFDEESLEVRREGRACAIVRARV